MAARRGSPLSSAARVMARYASAVEGWPSIPTDWATASASSPRVSARSVLPDQASTKAKEPRPLTLQIE